MNQPVTTRPRTAPIQTSLRRWLPSVALASALLTAGSPVQAQDSAWRWQGETDKSDTSSGGIAHFSVEQNYSGTVAAEGQATILTAPTEPDGGLEAAIFAAANFLAFAGSSGSTVLTVHQFRADNTGSAQSENSGRKPPTSATLSNRPTNGESDTDAVMLDVQAIHNYLSIDLSSDEASYEFISSIDQQSSGDVSATTGGDAWVDGGAGSSQTSRTDTGGETGQASGGMRTVAIGNFTSLRYGAGADSR